MLLLLALTALGVVTTPVRLLVVTGLILKLPQAPPRLAPT
jgi:hypothetical protein